MPIEFICKGCAQKLRVKDTDAGKTARCPNCQTVFTAPAGVGRQASEASGASNPVGQQPFSQQPSSQKPVSEQSPSGNPYADSSGAGGQNVTSNPYASPKGTFPPPGSRSFGKPHRGGAILTMGIIGLLVCNILAIVALVMGSQDLAAMNRGEMDSSGRGMTIAGMVIAGIGLGFTALMLVFQFLIVALDN